MYTLLVTGDVPGASTYFNPLLQQSIVPCTSGTRPGSPVNGQFIYETDTKKVQRWDGSAWRPVAGERTSYTPVLTATTTNPSLGTSPTVGGWYIYTPAGIQVDFYLKFGTSPSIGSGNYLVSLPFTSATPFGSGIHPVVGTIQLGDSSSGVTNPGSCFVDPSTGNNVGLVSASGGTVGPTSPWTWAASDYISGTIIYPV